MIEEELIMSKIYISQLFNDNEIIDLMILYPDKEKLNEYIANMIGSENI